MTGLRYGTPEEAGMSPERVRHLAALCEGWVAEGVTTALSVLVARRGVIVLHDAWGKTSHERDAPAVTRETVFPIGSGTKPVTATVVMQLVEDGLLGLNRPVQDYIPEFTGEGKEAVLVHHLLTHTSGLNEMDLLAHVGRKTGVAPVLGGQRTTVMSRSEILEARYDAPLSKRPGETMSYCNLNYALLGEIVQRASGRTLADVARETVFTPLGMTDTDYILPDERVSRLVRRPPGAPFPFMNRIEQFRVGLGQGGVTSTAHDMARFGQIFLDGGRGDDARILSTATVREMTRNQIPGISAIFPDGSHVPEGSWSYGWAIFGGGKWKYYAPTLCSPHTLVHPGAGGFGMWADPVAEIVGVYCSVLLEQVGGVLPRWSFDLFADAVTAAATDGEPLVERRPIAPLRARQALPAG